jgi:hypothetical protein
MVAGAWVALASADKQFEAKAALQQRQQQCPVTTTRSVYVPIYINQGTTTKTVTAAGQTQTITQNGGAGGTVTVTQGGAPGATVTVNNAAGTTTTTATATATASKCPCPSGGGDVFGKFGSFSQSLADPNCLPKGPGFLNRVPKTQVVLTSQTPGPFGYYGILGDLIDPTGIKIGTFNFYFQAIGAAAFTTAVVSLRPLPGYRIRGASANAACSATPPAASFCALSSWLFDQTPLSVPPTEEYNFSFTFDPTACTNVDFAIYADIILGPCP